MALTIHIAEKKPGLHEVALGGRLDTDTSGQLDQKITEILTKKVQAVRFDMAQLNYISSMGIRVLFKAFKALRAKKAMFLMANLQPQIKKVLEIAQALPPETVFASVKEADDYFDAMQRKVLDADPDEA
jgi:anti-anti-sigma factor